MPQMGPLLWLNLMIIFLLTFVVFLSVSYFLKLPSCTEEKVSKKPTNQKNWSW